MPFTNLDLATSFHSYVQLKLEQGDEFLVLACDGIWDVKTNQQVVDFVKERLQQVSLQLSAIVIDASDVYCNLIVHAGLLLIGSVRLSEKLPLCSEAWLFKRAEQAAF